MHRFYSLVAFFALATVSQAQAPAPLPASLPPEVCLAKAVVKDDGLYIRVTSARLVPEQRERVVKRNGMEVVEKYLTYTPVAVERLLRPDGKKVRVTTKAGKDVDAQGIVNALGKDTPVIVSFDGAVDPFYLAVVRDDVLIITQERPAAAQGK